MSRPLRLSYEGACYHIVNRGNRREDIFFCDRDYELFLEKLAYYAEVYDVQIYSYCLMNNHFHIQLKTNLANISNFMKSFLTSFTISINRKYGKSGHLFQGRYNAKIIETELYKNKLSRYIHLNPIKIRAHKDSSLEEVKKVLHDYKWSSFRSYIGICKKEKWLNRNHVLSSWGKDAKSKQYNYREYVENGLLRNNNEDLTPSEITNIIGSDSFKDRIIKKYLISENSYLEIDNREQPDLSKINSITFEKIIDTVINHYDISEKEILLKEKCHKEARKVAIYLSVEYCRRRETLTSLAKKFNMKISGIKQVRSRFYDFLNRNAEIRLKIEKIKENL